MKTPIILLACGCFNPITNMHLRIFELAKDYANRMGQYEVIGGIISPVHDGYGKKDLECASHRTNMIKVALQGNDWIKLSDWEVRQESWTRTRLTLQYHQNKINAYLHSTDNNIDINEEELQWMPDNIRKRCLNRNVLVKLLCGADLLESFGTPGLWADEDIEAIVGYHGLIVITRCNVNPAEFIYNSDLLTRYMNNIVIVTEWIQNEISSTKIRRALRRSESVKYLIPDNVIDYIYKHFLYGTKKNKFLNPVEIIEPFHLTTYPTDTTMNTPSPDHCLYICNNKFFNTRFEKISVDSFRSHTKMASSKHPGQAVKIINDNNGDYSILCKETDLSQKVWYENKDENNSRNYDEVENETRGKCSPSFNIENSIKFVFTEKGIQVISDIETVV